MCNRLPIMVVCLVIAVHAGMAADASAVVKGFQASLDPQQAAKVAPIFERGTGNAQLTEAVLMISPDIIQGLRALNQDDLVAASRHFGQAAASKNPYVAAHAKWFNARVLVRQEQFEDALAVLVALRETATDHALLADEWQLNIGLLHAYLLNREEAIANLEAYLKTYPDAPAARREMAAEQIEFLRAYEDETIVEVRDLMNDSRRRLAQSDSREPTIERQERIVAVLDKLIKDSEGGGGGGGGGGGQGQGQGQGQGSAQGGASGGLGQGAKESSISEGEGGVGSLEHVSASADAADWAKAYAKDREEVLTELQGDFPDRYRDLIEQYYQSLQRTGDE